MKRTSFRAQSFQRSLRAQGTIEYLVVIAVVIVLALVVIGLLTSLSSPAGAVVKSSSELKNKLGVGGLNVVDVVAGSNEDGLLVLQNVSSDPLTVYKVSIDGADHNFCDLIAAGSQLSLKLDNINACNGSNKNYTVKVYFNSAANLPNSADFATMTVDCVTGEVTPAGSFAEENSSNGCGRPTKYTVSFDSQGGSLISPISGIISGATIALPLAPTKTGYVFSGWYTGTNGSGSSFTGSTIISGNVTIYANWVAAVYVVTYDNQGADVNASPSSQTVTFPASSVGLLPTAPTKTGYIFGGWYTGINGNGSSFIGSTPVSSSIFVYANWLAYSYTVYFDSQGADINASPVTKSVVSPATTVGSLPTAPTKTNYTFDGWYTQISGGGTAFTGSTTVLGDLNVYAKWTFVSPPVLLLDLRFDTNATYVPGSGYLTHDLSGNGNDGNVVNSVWLPTGGHEGIPRQALVSFLRRGRSLIRRDACACRRPGERRTCKFH